MNHLKKIVPVMLIALLLGSCSAHKKIPYLIEAEALSEHSLAESALLVEPRIMPKDLLSISVNTPTPEASHDFNLPVAQADLLRPAGHYPGYTNQESSSRIQSYLVDNEGCIRFPVLGKLRVGGLTKGEVEQLLFARLYPDHLKEEPVITIRFLNYRVSVLGEVARPDSYAVFNERLTLLDALAMAGDLTIYGNRKNVLLIREDETGRKETHRINLQDKDLLLQNDLYYLRQNDIVYVQPNRAKGNNSSFGTLESWVLSGVSILISIISLATR